jgi:hypothetical protein
MIVGVVALDDAATLFPAQTSLMARSPEPSAFPTKTGQIAENLAGVR